MAFRRMISKDVICTDSFLDMPFEAQALFFQLQINADEYGFVQSPRGIIRTMAASAEALDVLITNGYVIQFDSGVIVMRHWNVANTRRADRTAKVRFPVEYGLLEVDEMGVFRLRDDNGMTLTSQRDDNGNPSNSLSVSHSPSNSHSLSVNPSQNKATEIEKISSSSSIKPRVREKDEPDDDDPFRCSLVKLIDKIPYLNGQTEKVLEYRTKLSDELIIYGIERAREYGGKSLKYLRVILDSLVERGYVTVEQAEAAEKQHEKCKGGTNSGVYRGHCYGDAPMRIAGETIV